mmetsp:Transcript_28919/g.53134  ORF Transcript_28919/g.53134 Transcript_28919/m.53134 type:complete len:110 (-) Transcript_28919:463-792(-)|eukprot:CAMPEP_0175073866 /NCGR_PEP_ID=MMETSP0052_2-20121109/20868_1 /TAXON_ID=51329 ORGANISM="Polytomella parva, Strain SAG 63-3" /NCGR_SAMPLE_ID=MMETSP0052_2 /ASSEMBLY_ACC=CAM_ASM_000194 /LENGTH=109 /DNA_ID=CAMNT_0016341859 /DNA_START=39 /DNA_END=368 /DNA_ORIENTATION=-
MGGGINRRQRMKEEEESAKQELLAKYLMYFKQLVALSLGIFLGAIGVTGYRGFLSFLLVFYGTSYFIVKRLNLEDDENNNSIEMILEDVPNSLGMFILSWVATYNAVAI